MDNQQPDRKSTPSDSIGSNDERGGGAQPRRGRRRGGRRRRRGRGGAEQNRPRPAEAAAGPVRGPDAFEPVDENALVLSESFRALGLSEPALKAVAAMGFEDPTPVQEEMIPLALAGKDVLGQARTGTGKTAAFALPIIEKADRAGGTQALVLVPTRELAMQVHDEIAHLARFAPISCVAVYGGAPLGGQLRRLAGNPHIVVGTPGRVMDMLQRGALRLDGIRWAVLDEVDRMLDIGFRDDIRWILKRIPAGRQMMFVSATLPDDVNRLVEEFAPNVERRTLSSDRLTVEHVRQLYVSVEAWDKYRMLRRLLDVEKPELAIVFTNTKHQTRRVCERLQHDGIDARQIHGDLMQRQRDRVMQSFREQKISVLVATDLMGRGIDVPGISHIINYDLPDNAELYVHRIGRTARMGAVGVAISLVTPEEGPELTEIEKLINLQLEKRVVEGFEPSAPPPIEAARRQAESAAEAARKEAPPERIREPVFADEQFKKEHGLPPKTLGSPFKTPDRRRLKRLKRR